MSNPAFTGYDCFNGQELASVVILYTKVYTLYSIYWHDGFWKASFYIIGWFAFSAVFPQPWYRGPTKITELSETSFREKIFANKQKNNKSTPITEIKGPRIQEIHDEDEDSGHMEEKKRKYKVRM
ncbi:unnamed protein product [Cunninghamella echinulata]